MPTVTLRGVVDTLVYQTRPTTSYATRTDLQVRATSSALVSFLQVTGLPSGPGTVISSAKLYVTLMRAWTSPTSTITVKRLTSSWVPSQTTWNESPSHTTTGQVTVTVPSGSPAGTVLVFELAGFAQAWASGTPNYGVRLDTASGSIQYLYASEALADADLKPRMVVTWSAPPATPTALSPANGQQVGVLRPTLTWVYPSGLAAPMVSYQVQVNTADVWTAPAHDTGEVAASAPMHVLDFDATPGLFWRVRHKSADGDWSPWSPTATFGYTVKPALTITDPVNGGAATDATPTVAWSFGGTQTRWQVLLRRDTTILLDSGVQPGTSTSFTSTVALNYSAGAVTAEVRVWGNVDRATTPGDPAYILALSTFTYTPDSTVGPATSLVAVVDPVMPVAQLTWQRSPVPDAWTILRNGVPVLTSTGIALRVAGANYAWTDTLAQPFQTLTYTVIAGVNGVDSANPPTAQVTIKPKYIWLLDPADPTWWLALADKDQLGLTLGDPSTMIGVRDSDRMVLVTERSRGYEGTVSGGIYASLPGMGGFGAQSLRDRLWHVKKYPTRVYRLIVGDLNIPVVVRNLNVVVQPDAELRYKASFEAYQQGELPW